MTNAFNHIVRECHLDGVAVNHEQDCRLLLCDGVPFRLRQQWRTHRPVGVCGLRWLSLNDAFWHNPVTARHEQREYGRRSRSNGVSRIVSCLSITSSQGESLTDWSDAVSRPRDREGSLVAQ
jgi:hypothetical protein